MSRFKPKIADLPCDVRGKKVERMYTANYQVSAAKAVAASDTGVHAAIELAAEAQDITTDITSPAVPRAMRIKGNQAGVAGNVVITGTNYTGKEINEVIAANGDTEVDGDKAFKTITKITVPPLVGDGNSISVGWNDKLGLPINARIKVSHKQGKRQEKSEPLQ